MYGTQISAQYSTDTLAQIRIFHGIMIVICKFHLPNWVTPQYLIKVQKIRVWCLLAHEHMVQ